MKKIPVRVLGLWLMLAVIGMYLLIQQIGRFTISQELDIVIPKKQVESNTCSSGCQIRMESDCTKSGTDQPFLLVLDNEIR
jgi:hypothetical protein